MIEGWQIIMLISLPFLPMIGLIFKVESKKE